MKRWVYVCMLALPLLVASSLSAAPPQAAAGARKFKEWQPPNVDPSQRRYGDPGWSRRMRARRVLRERIAAGRTDLAATLRSDKFSLPVLLGNFGDLTGTYSQEEFQNNLFGANPNGSMIDYYKEISYGQFELSGQVYGWFDSGKEKAYYVDNNVPYEFVRDVVAQADPSVDFSQYDNDGPDGVPNSGDDDGFVDAVYVICPGYEDNEAFHAHMWTLEDAQLGAYETDDPAAGGGTIKINAYGITEEQYSPDGENYQIQPIGTLCHEFGHLLGLTDLYDRTDDTKEPDFRSSEGIGQWGLMGSGNYGATGDNPGKPVQMCAWNKIQLGWLSPTVVTADGQVSLAQVETTPAALKIWEDPFHSFRYFLIENREAVGFDSEIPSSGLLIYHVDESRVWDLNSYSGPGNDDYRSKLVDVEEADGSDDLDNSVNRSDSGDPFPGASGNRTFDESSYPGSRDSEGNTTGVAVREISDPAETMTALISVRKDGGYTLAYDEKGITEFFSYSGPDNWVGVDYRTAEAGRLEAVVLGVSDEQARMFEVRVYDSFNGGKPGNLLTSQVFSSVGGMAWQTVTLDHPVELAADKEFFLAVSGMETFGADSKGQPSGKTYFSSDGTNYSPLQGLSGTAVDYPLRALVRTSGGTVEPPKPMFTGAIGDCSFPGAATSYTLWADVDPAAAVMSVKLIAGTDGGATFPVSLECERSGNRFSVSLPAIEAGAHYSFYFEGLESEGGLVRLPENAPSAVYTLTVNAVIPITGGDVDGNGKTDVFDLLSLLKSLSGTAPSGQNSDVDENGKTDIFDLLALLKKLAQ
ncbi:M6 family metalloprotease domain-containing protein [bacterium]|nr:M6 family metalloprotease domain-containing protein [bacterium]